MCYYNGITGNDGCPEPVYRPDALTTPFPKPVGRFGEVPVKSIHGVFDTPSNKVWDTVGPQISDILKAHKVKWAVLLAQLASSHIVHLDMRRMAVLALL